jgi:hypothetical protein
LGEKKKREDSYMPRKAMAHKNKFPYLQLYMIIVANLYEHRSTEATEAPPPA